MLTFLFWASHLSSMSLILSLLPDQWPCLCPVQFCCLPMSGDRPWLVALAPCLSHLMLTVVRMSLWSCNDTLYTLPISYSEYLVRNPVQAALRSDKRHKANKSSEYFWLGRTLGAEASRNLFQICSKFTPDSIMN